MRARTKTAEGQPSRGIAWPLLRLLPVLAILLLFSFLLGPGRNPTGDEAPLIAAAQRLLDGGYAVAGTMDAPSFLWHGPGLPAMIAPLVALGTPLAGLRLTSPILMFAAVLLFYRLLRLRLSRRGALIGAYALGLWAPGYYVLGTVSKDPLALLLSICALDGTARYLKWGRTHHALIAGLSLGALVMTRLEYGWVVSGALVAAGLWWLAARVRDGTGREGARVPGRFALVCAVGMLVCVPWLVYTYSLTGHLFYWGNSGGISLYWMSSPSPGQLGEWHSARTVATDPALAGYRPFFDQLATLTPLQRDLRLDHVAIAQAVGHPAKYALNLLANLGRMFFGFPFSFTLSASTIAGAIAFNGALLAGLAAAVRRLWRARSSLPPETLPFALFAALGFTVHLLPSAEPRMLLPILPVFIWLIAQGARGWAPAFSRITPLLARVRRFPRSTELGFGSHLPEDRRLTVFRTQAGSGRGARAGSRPGSR